MGLLIGLDRLATIRKERRSSGIYADPAHVKMELDALKELFGREKIPYVDTTTRSVEEIAASIMGMLASRIH
jgi:regulator of PEP synthase PpsR (kinase-PPPase family)